MKPRGMSSEVRTDELTWQADARDKAEAKYIPPADTPIPTGDTIQIGEWVAYIFRFGEGCESVDIRIAEVAGVNDEQVAIRSPHSKYAEWITKTGFHRGAVIGGRWRPKWAIDRYGIDG